MKIVAICLQCGVINLMSCNCLFLKNSTYPAGYQCFCDDYVVIVSIFSLFMLGLYLHFINLEEGGWSFAESLMV